MHRNFSILFFGVSRSELAFFRFVRARGGLIYRRLTGNASATLLVRRGGGARVDLPMHSSTGIDGRTARVHHHGRARALRVGPRGTAPAWDAHARATAG